MGRKKLLIVPGSLRQGSSTAAIVNALQDAVSDRLNANVYDGIGTLPHFDGSEQPDGPVISWRKALKQADGVIICTPEYAFGIPGSLKNAIDWTVSSGELAGKPLALITAATGGDKAHAAWLLIFQALSARVPDECQLLIPFVRSKMNMDGVLTDEETLRNIDRVVEGLDELLQGASRP